MVGEMSDGSDSLVGLRFELSGGLGKMAGEIVGRAGELYLVQRDGADHLELLELSDLRSAKFYRSQAVDRSSGASVTPLKPAPAAASVRDTAQPRLSDKIRRSSEASDLD